MAIPHRALLVSILVQRLKLKADRLRPCNYLHMPIDYRHTDKNLSSAVRAETDGRTDWLTDGRTDGRYQVHYLLRFAVDNDVMTSHRDVTWCHYITLWCHIMTPYNMTKWTCTVNPLENPKKHIFQPSNLDLWPMTLTFKLIQNIVKVNLSTKL